MKPYISVGIFNVPTYGIFASFGALIAMLFIYNCLVNNRYFTFLKYMALIGFMAIGAAIGSKTIFVVTLIPDIMGNWSFSYASQKVVTAGFVFYGGLFGALAGVYAFSKIFKIPFGALTNKICPAFPLFHAFGRIGCLFAGCCYGKVIEKGFYHLSYEPGISRIPVQLYESIFLILLFILLLWLTISDRKIALMPVYLVIYAVWRFIIEYYRGDKIRGIWGPFSTSQWISISIILFVGIIRLKKHLITCRENC